MPNLTASSKCDSVLVPDTVVMQRNLTYFAAFLRIVEQSNYEQYKQQYAADLPGYFAGDFSSFSEARSRFFEKEQYTLNYQEAVSILQTGVSDEKAKAWLQCMESNSYGLFAFLRQADENGATLTIKWSPPPGLEELRECSIVLQQGAADAGNAFQGNAAFTGETSVLIQRGSPNEPVRGYVRGVAGVNGGYSQDFLIPAVPKEVDAEVRDESSSMSFDSEYTVPRTKLPVPITLGLKVQTSATGEYFTQAARFIQQYVWIDGALKNDSGERTDDFPEGYTKTLEWEANVPLAAGQQLKVKVRNNAKGAKGGPTKVSWKGTYKVLK